MKEFLKPINEPADRLIQAVSAAEKRIMYYDYIVYGTYFYLSLALITVRLLT